jgi:ADYC domain-containing protein
MLEDPEADDVGEIEQEGRVINGRVINGRVINGRLINGTAFSGYLKAAKLDHVLIAGTYRNGVKITNGVFTYGTTTGAGFVGAVFDGLTTDGKTVPIRVDSYRLVAPDLPAYRLSYQTDVGWNLLCSDVADTTAEAFALTDVWNFSEGIAGTSGSRGGVTGQFTFACGSVGAIGKCVSFGYVPWRKVGGVVQRDAHQSCTRALRADYCGDGISRTTDGTPINLFDIKLILVDTESWPTEAVWRTNGAKCIDKTRADQAVIDGNTLPLCAQQVVKVGCDQDFYATAPIKTEFMPH